MRILRDASLIAAAIDSATQVVIGAVPLTYANGHVECVILACRSPVSPKRIDLVKKIRHRMPWVTVIFVADPVTEILSGSETAPFRISCGSRTSRPNSNRIHALRRRTELFGLAEQTERLTLPVTLCLALSPGLRAATDRPVRNVSELAGVVGSARVTLSQAFRKSVTGESTLRDSHNASVVLRSHHLRTSGCSWNGVK